MFTVKSNLPIFDSHIHFGCPNFAPGLVNILDQHTISLFNIVCTSDYKRLSLVPDGLYLKSLYTERC